MVRRERLQVFLARSGIASRRASERIIAAGRVMINGTTVTSQGVQVGPEDRVTLDNNIIKMTSSNIYMSLNKPVGYLCTNFDARFRPVARSLIPIRYGRLFHVGRLDRLSEGLIFFTNDGKFAEKVTHPSFEVEKEYDVTTNKIIPESLLDKYLNGLTLDDTWYQLSRYHFYHGNRVRLILKQGRKREIRRIMRIAGLEVQRLTRIRIGVVHLAGLLSGGWQSLKPEDVEWFLGRKVQRPVSFKQID